MRLICPNCDAEYEVDDAAIPREGRDVQCSACGHAWFQEHPEVEAAREAEAALYEPPEGAKAPEPIPEAAAEAAPEPVSEPEDEPAAKVEAAPPVPEDAPPQPPPLRARSLDDAVLSVLREEAEREQAARRAEAMAPRLESQTEMPLAPAARAAEMPAAVRRIAEMRGLAKTAEEPAEPPAPEAAPESGSESEPGPATPALPARTRAHVFPAIEEINSTLRATSDRVQDGEDVVAGTLPEGRARRGAFARGFVLLVSLAVIIVALYLLAPVIAARVPALEGLAQAYVAAVDAARVALDGALRGLVATLRGLTSDQQG